MARGARRFAPTLPRWRGARRLARRAAFRSDVVAQAVCGIPAMGKHGAALAGLLGMMARNSSKGTTCAALRMLSLHACD
jgi:hypothetical protein